MPATTDFGDILSEQMTSGIDRAREINLAVLEVARAFTALLQPDMSTGVRSEASPFALPVVGTPSAIDAIDQAFNFAGRMLDLQHDYVVRIAEAMMPAFPAAQV